MKQPKAWESTYDPKFNNSYNKSNCLDFENSKADFYIIVENNGKEVLAFCKKNKIKVINWFEDVFFRSDEIRRGKNGAVTNVGIKYLINVSNEKDMFTLQLYFG